MQPPATLREQAARLLALAMQARDKGNVELAKLMTDAAARYLDQAVTVEAAEKVPRPTNDGPLTLQQQQVQPKEKE